VILQHRGPQSEVQADYRAGGFFPKEKPADAVFCARDGDSPVYWCKEAAMPRYQVSFRDPATDVATSCSICAESMSHVLDAAREMRLTVDSMSRSPTWRERWKTAPTSAVAPLLLSLTSLVLAVQTFRFWPDEQWWAAVVLASFAIIVVGSAIRTVTAKEAGLDSLQALRNEVRGARPRKRAEELFGLLGVIGLAAVVCVQVLGAHSRDEAESSRLAALCMMTLTTLASSSLPLRGRVIPRSIRLQ
jgi:hypothetical protein